MGMLKTIIFYPKSYYLCKELLFECSYSYHKVAVLHNIWTRENRETRFCSQAVEFSYESVIPGRMPGLILGIWESLNSQVNQGLSNLCRCTVEMLARRELFLNKFSNVTGKNSPCHGLASAAACSAWIRAWQNRILAGQYRYLVHFIIYKPDPALKQPSRLLLKPPYTLQVNTFCHLLLWRKCILDL